MISEETSAPEFQQRRHWAWHWLIDPLDGTKEFLQGRDEYTSNIALVKGTQAVLGVIHVPAAATTYFAARGLGAWRQTAQMPPQKIHTRPWPVVPKVLVSRSHPGAVLQHLLAQQAAHDCLPMGSALKFCRLAAGEADMYPRLVPSSAWDTAAGQIVLEEAGGRLLTKMGLSLNYNQPSLLNPTFIAFGADSGVDLQTWLAQL